MELVGLEVSFPSPLLPSFFSVCFCLFSFVFLLFCPSASESEKWRRRRELEVGRGDLGREMNNEDNLAERGYGE